MDHQELARSGMLFRCLSGSRAYGMSTPTSDVDIRGVFAAPPLNVVTPFFGVEQVDFPGDEVIFELSKYARMIGDQNPTMLELLWTDEDNILFQHPAWMPMRDARAEFLTDRVRNTFGGYAMSQLKRMKGHDRWINNPQPEAPPRPADFMRMSYNIALDRAFNSKMPNEGNWTAVGVGQDSYLLYPGGGGSWFDATGNIRTFTRHQVRDLVDNSPVPAAMIKWDRKEYERRKQDHDNYWTWKRERNPARAALEAERGYDAKAAGHLIRMLRQAHEALTEGVVRVRRPDAAELLSIRLGEWPMERVMAEAERLDAALPEAAAKSGLRSAVDPGRLAAIVMEMYERAWSHKKLVKAALPEAVTAPGGPPDLRLRSVVLDLELTGIASGQPQIVEVAAVELMGGFATGRAFHSYVNPEGPINPVAEKIHGLSERFLADQPTFAAIAPELMAFLGSSPILAHNAHSDARALHNDLSLANLPVLPPEQFTCTERLARRMFGVPMSLDTLCQTMDVDIGPRSRGHSAMVDATLLAGCVLRMGRMPDYATASYVQVGVREMASRAVRKLDRIKAAAEGQALEVDISHDAGEIRFVLADGRTLSMEIPAYPADTHMMVVQGDATVLVLRRGIDGGRAVADNPDGPAIMGVRGGALRCLWMKDGHKTPAPAAVSPEAEADLARTPPSPSM